MATLDIAGNYPYIRAMRDGSPDLCTCATLRAASRRMTRAYDEALAPVDLGLNQYAILSRLDRLGPLGLQALADLLVTDRSTLGRLLRPLEARGLLTITVDARDRRGRIIALTRAGTTLIRRARPLWAKAEAHFLAVYGADEAASLRAMLDRVVAVDLSYPDHR